MAKELGLNRDEGVTLISEIKKDLLFMFQSQPRFRWFGENGSHRPTYFFLPIT